MTGGIGYFPHGGIRQRLDEAVEFEIDEETVTDGSGGGGNQSPIPSQIQDGIDDHQGIENGVC